MRSSIEHPCAHCHAISVLRGAQVFVPHPCPACGVVTRARDEIGGYQLREILARSGLGIIFLAADRAGVPLAVKVLQPPLAAESTDIEYFASEVWSLAQLNHPHCLRIFATGVDQGVAWIAMEWLTHGSLADRLAARGPLREAEVLSIGVQAASALGAAHAAGHGHRDLEPNNLVFADALTVKVTDFGQAALYQISADDLGTIWGRPCYVSPERLRSEPEEAHSDIYSLGAVLFHALTGTPLHDGEPHGQLVLDRIESGDMRVDGMVSPLHDKTALVINRMLTSEPSERFQYWSEVVTQLSTAGALVARREAPSLVRQPVPVKAVAPAVVARPPAGSRLRGAWMAVVLLVVLGTAGAIAWKYRARFQPAPPRAITTPRSFAPTPSAKPTTPKASPTKKKTPKQPLSAASPPRSPPPRSGSPPSSPPARAR